MRLRRSWMSGTRMSRNSLSSRSLVSCSRLSAVRRYAMGGFRCIAHHGVNTNAARSEKTMAAEPRAGIGSM